MTGAVSYHAGRVAEDQVAAQYQARGMTVAARRWRGSAGEIDLILRDGLALIFVEVKQAETLDEAALRLNSAQIGRICGAASEFVAGEPMGQNTEMRFDLALVDGQGMIRIVENAFLL